MSTHSMNSPEPIALTSGIHTLCARPSASVSSICSRSHTANDLRLCTRS